MSRICHICRKSFEFKIAIFLFVSESYYVISSRNREIKYSRSLLLPLVWKFYLQNRVGNESNFLHLFDWIQIWMIKDNFKFFRKISENNHIKITLVWTMPISEFFQILIGDIFLKINFYKECRKKFVFGGCHCWNYFYCYLVCCCKIKIVKNRILQLFWKTLWRKTSPSKFIWLLLQRFFCVKNCRFWFNQLLLLRFVTIVGDHNFCRFLMDNFKKTCKFSNWWITFLLFQNLCLR